MDTYRWFKKNDETKKKITKRKRRVRLTDEFQQVGVLGESVQAGLQLLDALGEIALVRVDGGR